MALPKMRRVLAPISMVAAFGLVLAGCSGDNGNTDDGGAADTGEGEEESPDEGGGDEFDGVTLEVSGAWSGAEQENFEQVLAQFEDNTGANINYTSFGDKRSEERRVGKECR